MNNTAVELKGIYAGYDAKPVLANVNLKVIENDFVGIIGPNGSGKSTLIKTILGLLSPTAGTVSYYRHGQPADQLRVGYLPQQSVIDRQFPISVTDVIRTGLAGNCSSPRLKFSQEQNEKVRQTVTLMGLEEVQHATIGQLSGGQLQRTFLGRAMVSDPELLVLDEPQSFIDRWFEEKLYEILVEINQHTTILMVSHDIGAVLAYAKTIACVNGTVHTHPNRELPPDWIHRHFSCEVERISFELDAIKTKEKPQYNL